MSQNTNNLAVLLHLGKLAIAVGIGLTTSVLLGTIPVLVESAKNLLLKVRGPHSAQGTKTRRSFNVSDHTDNHDVGALDDGDGFNTFLLVHLGSRLVDITDNVGHTSLVTEESGQVRSSGSIILGEGLALSSVSGSALTGQESKGSMSRSFEFSVGHAGAVWGKKKRPM